MEKKLVMQNNKLEEKKYRWKKSVYNLPKGELNSSGSIFIYAKDCFIIIILLKRNSVLGNQVLFSILTVTYCAAFKLPTVIMLSSSLF